MTTERKIKTIASKKSISKKTPTKAKEPEFFLNDKLIVLKIGNDANIASPAHIQEITKSFTECLEAKGINNTVIFGTSHLVNIEIFSRDQ